MHVGLAPEMGLPGGGTERVASFAVDGAVLRGTLAVPATPCTTVAVFVHGWSGVRGGPNRLFVHVARALLADGVASLRFDLRGRGESEGEGLEASLETMAADFAAGVEFARRETGCERVLPVGICSGANVVIGTLDRLPKRGVAGLLLLSAYPFSDGDSFGRDLGRTWHHLRVYWHKLLRGSTWRRLLRGELDFRSIGTVLFGHFRKAESAEPAAVRQAGTAAGKTAAAAAKEGRFEEAPPTTQLRKLRGDVPTLFLYGTADPDATAARKYYETYARDHGLPAEFAEIVDADHNFSSVAWTEEVVRRCRAFWQSA